MSWNGKKYNTVTAIRTRKQVVQQMYMQKYMYMQLSANRDGHFWFAVKNNVGHYSTLTTQCNTELPNTDSRGKYTVNKVP